MIRRNPWIIPLFLFLSALTLRFVYLFQLKEGPFLLFFQGDGKSYYEWGKTIAEGDWLGQDVFYQAPFYPYLLGLIQAVFGSNIVAIRLVQVVLGSLACLFLYLAGAHFFSKASGLAAGLLACLYAPAIYYDGLIQKTGIAFFLMAMSLWMLGRAIQKSGNLSWFGLGIALGLLTLTRENAAALIVVILLGLHFGSGVQLKSRRWLAVALILAGSCFILGTVGIRNWVLSDTFSLTTSQLGPNLYLGNNPQADGFYHPLVPGRGNYLFEQEDAISLAEEALGRSLLPDEVSSYWIKQAFHFMKTQTADWLLLTLKKLHLSLNYYEIPDTDDYAIHLSWSSLLTGLNRIFNFGILAPLACAGFFLAWPLRKKILILYAAPIVLLLSMLPFVIYGRYRFILVPVLFLFAGHALISGFKLLQQKSYQFLVPALIGGLVMTFVANQQIYSPDLPQGLLTQGLAYQYLGNPAQALESFSQAIRQAPNFLHAYLFRGSIYQDQHRHEKALEDFDAVVRMYPTYPDVYLLRGKSYASIGMQQKAIQDFTQTLSFDPENPKALLQRGIVCSQSGQYDQALQDFNKLIQLFPNRAEYYHNRGLLYQEGFQNMKAACSDWKHACLSGNCTYYELVVKKGAC
ncbi:MAG: tetratricopeptide repeat protein [SAR324 cluster bacterium]|nr:tetratricopeptide repeat protein [SAR324 cluster bacterium]